MPKLKLCQKKTWNFKRNSLFVMGKHRKVKGKLTLKFCSCLSMETDDYPEENRPYSPKTTDCQDGQVSIYHLISYTLLPYTQYEIKEIYK